VSLVAEMIDLRPVRLDNVFFFTGPEKATRLEALHKTGRNVLAGAYTAALVSGSPPPTRRKAAPGARPPKPPWPSARSSSPGRRPPSVEEKK
jgi:hypothetical protein